MKARKLSAFVAVGLFGCALADAGAATAQSPAEFYAGKRVNVIIGYSAGAGYDQYARVLARFMGEHIPGKPTLIPQNMPGAGSRKAANWLYNVAPKDGATLATLGQNTATDQALKADGVQFDVRKFNWIGNMVVVNNVLSTWAASGIKTIEDATKKQSSIGGTGAASPSVIYPQVANNLLGTKFKIIAGYPGGGDVNLAMERGEVDGRGSNSWASYKSTKADWLRDNKVNILFQVGPKREDDLPDVPLLTDLAKTPEQKKVFEVLSADVSVGRPILTTPGVPQDRVDALRKAFDDMFKDKAFLAEAEKQKMDISPMTGAELQKIVAATVEMPDSIIAMVKSAIEIRDMEALAPEKGGVNPNGE
jgi:tripartite-type tricarboxylate transporter receptor subunit TctC